MTYPSRFLKSASSPATEVPPPTETVDSDFVVILAALLCALICVLGLIAVARCAWIRRLTGGGTGGAHATANKGLKKKVLRSLPKLAYSADLCIDTWLGSHSSCPSCRQILALTSRCDKCGSLPAESSSPPQMDIETGPAITTFLP